MRYLLVSMLACLALLVSVPIASADHYGYPANADTTPGWSSARVGSCPGTLGGHASAAAYYLNSWSFGDARSRLGTDLTGPTEDWRTYCTSGGITVRTYFWQLDHRARRGVLYQADTIFSNNGSYSVYGIHAIWQGWY
jgi:hypothetical protein